MLLTIAAFLFVLSIVILVHELGHFLVAKMNGIYVITFSMGFGPKILKFKWGETEYAISALPFGGYVKFAGEDADEGGKKDGDEKVDDLDIPEHRLYRNKNPYQRMSVVLAGPVMNAVLALLLYIFNIWSQGVFVREPDSIISGVVAGSPAEEAGILRGDRVIEINDHGLDKDSQISDLVIYEERSNPRNGETVVALVEDEATLKRFYRERNRIRLQPANEKYKPIYTRDATIQGVVIGIIRRF